VGKKENIDNENPFDDPEVQALMAEMGMVHAPGTAAAMMQEVAPFLAADGFDINDPATFDDLDAFNEALQRAIDQLNFRRFVAVGEPLAYALALLRLLTESVADETWGVWEALIDAIPPDPESPERASVAHVIGTSLSRLDTWLTDPDLAKYMGATAIPRGDSASHKAARDCFALGLKGRAFDSIEPLIVRYRGLALLEGASLAVSQCVIAWAGATGQDVDTGCRVLLMENAQGEGSDSDK
jgi:hypothetical protein